MAAKKKRVDPIKQRERRARIAAIIGGVLFLALAAYEVPSVLKMMNQKPPPGSNVSDAGNRNPDGSIPLPSVATSSAQSSGGGQLADSDAAPSTGPGQLVSFAVFQTKNPFTPQVQLSDSGTSGSSSGSGGTTTTTTTTPSQPGAAPGGGTSTTPTTTNPGSVVPSTGGTTTTTTTTTAAAPTVAISVNGTVSRVATNDTFPTGAPVFRLISYSTGTAEIGIVGGSYADGNGSLTLTQGQVVTLENTTTDTKYKVELLSTP